MVPVQFLLTRLGFTSIILILLCLVILIYLLTIRHKSRASWLLIGFYLAVIANYVTMLLSNGLMFWNYWLAPVQDAWLQRPAMLAGLNAFIILSREATDEFTDHLYVCSEKVNKQLELS